MEDYGSLVNKLIRQKYTQGEVESILRQKDTKPQKYIEYYKYAEHCKAEAKGELDPIIDDKDIFPNKRYKHNMQWYTNYGLCSFSITTARAEQYTEWRDLLVDGSISLIDYTTVFSESLGFKLICMGKNDGFNLFSGEDVIIDRLFVDNVVNL